MNDYRNYQKRNSKSKGYKNKYLSGKKCIHQKNTYSMLCSTKYNQRSYSSKSMALQGHKQPLNCLQQNKHNKQLISIALIAKKRRKQQYDLQRRKTQEQIQSINNYNLQNGDFAQRFDITITNDNDVYFDDYELQPQGLHFDWKTCTPEEGSPHYALNILMLPLSKHKESNMKQKFINVCVNDNDLIDTLSNDVFLQIICVKYLYPFEIIKLLSLSKTMYNRIKCIKYGNNTFLNTICRNENMTHYFMCLNNLMHSIKEKIDTQRIISDDYRNMESDHELTNSRRSEQRHIFALEKFGVN